MISPRPSAESADQIDRDLGRRVLPGVATQMTLLGLLALAAFFHPIDREPLVAFATVLTSVSLVRVFLSLRQASFYPAHGRQWRWLYTATLLSSGLAWGGFAVGTLGRYDLVSFPSLCILLILAGISAGATTSLSPSPRHALSFLLTLLAPPALFLVATGTSTSLTFVGFMTCFFFSLSAQVRIQSREGRALRETVGHYHAIAESSGEGFAIHQGGRLVAVNPAMAAIFGTTVADLTGKPITVLCSAEEYERARPRAEANSSEIYEIRGTRKDGSQFPLEVCGIPCRWEGAAARAVRLRDLTAQKTVEAALAQARDDAEAEVARRTELLRDEQARLGSIIAHSPALVAMKDGEGRYVLANPQFLSLYSPEQGSPIGRTDLELWNHAPFAQKIREDDQRVFATGTTIRLEQEIPQASGSRSFYAVKFPIRDNAGVVKHVCVIATEITDAKRAQAEKAELEVRENAAREASRLKSEFLANMSHEIRTPLNGIVGMTDLILGSNLSAEQRDCAETIQRSGESLLSVINDILDFSKIEAGKLDFEAVDFDLRDRLNDIVRTFTHAADQKGLRLVLDCGPELPTSVRGDPGRFSQVLNNLLGNAVKFTRDGHVTVRIRRATAIDHTRVRLAVEVEDSGVGIAPEVLPHLFRPFVQADSSTTRRFGGTGLGLSISRSLVEKMHGELGVRSEPGRGSTFFFTVEFAMGEVRSAAPAANPLAQPIEGAPDFRVLVAEDNPVNQKIVLKMLERLGVRAQAVGDGKEAIAALRAIPYDLVLMDVQMPEMDGLTAARAIRNDPELGLRDLPIVALTANALKGDAEVCLAAGMNDYLTKPITADRLRATVSRWLAARRRAA